MNPRIFFKTFISILGVTGSLLGCNNDQSTSPTVTTDATPPQVQNDPPAPPSSRLELTESDMTLDNSGTFPRYKVSKTLSIGDKLQVHFRLNDLDNPAITVREQVIVPFNTEKEFDSEAWKVESPSDLSQTSLQDLEISKEAIMASKAATIKFFGLSEGQNMNFKLRITFYDSNSPQKTTIAEIEIPLAD